MRECNDPVKTCARGGAGKILDYSGSSSCIHTGIAGSSSPIIPCSRSERQQAVIALNTRTGSAKEVAGAVGVARETLYNWHHQSLGHAPLKPMTKKRDEGINPLGLTSRGAHYRWPEWIRRTDDTKPIRSISKKAARRTMRRARISSDA